MGKEADMRWSFLIYVAQWLNNCCKSYLTFTAWLKLSFDNEITTQAFNGWITNHDKC